MSRFDGALGLVRNSGHPATQPSNNPPCFRYYELLPLGFARTAPVGAENETGNAPQIEILVERPVEVGALLIRACSGADHLDSLVAEIPDEVVGTRSSSRPKRGRGCR